jgi:hypothetical protein
VLIYISTPSHEVKAATDIGCIKAAISLAKVFDADYYKHEINGRFAEVVKRKLYERN